MTTNKEEKSETEHVSTHSPPLSRRHMLVSLLGIGGLGLLMSDTVGGADPSANRWNTDVDAGGHALSNLDALTTANNSTEITDFVGTNLSVDDAGVLNATWSAPSWNEDLDARGTSVTNVGGLSTVANPARITDFAGDNLSVDESGALNATIPDTVENRDIIPLEKTKLLDSQTIDPPAEDEFTTLRDDASEDGFFPLGEYGLNGDKFTKLHVSVIGKDAIVPELGQVHVRVGRHTDWRFWIEDSGRFSSPKFTVAGGEFPLQRGFFDIDVVARLEGIPRDFGEQAVLHNVWMYLWGELT